jgi:deoxycytidylate deaminase
MNKADFAELVFGFVYGVGTDADPVIAVLDHYLKQYRYTAEVFRISEQLRSLELGISFDGTSDFERMGALMDAGNEACKRAHDDRMLAVMAINDIASFRSEDEQKRPIARDRTAHLIRSLKRPEEVQLLRQVYRPGFFLIGIAEDDDAQTAYLEKEIGLSEAQAKLLLERDRDEDLPFGQRTRKTFHLADVFVQRSGEAYKKQLERFLELVFGNTFRTPSKEEHAMFTAYASAARSAQLGRQVGAAIATPEGEVVAVGMNEVPSPRGGPYWDGDSDDSRDHKRKVDSNFAQRDRIVQSIVKKLDSNLLTEKNLLPIVKGVISDLKPGTGAADIERMAQEEVRKLQPCVIDDSDAAELVHASDLREITEYGRAVHGEMDAILNCVRLGVGVSGKYLFVTTFPCHNCTRHIISAGIRKVYYIEPYPKSRARDLHDDAICFDEAEAEKTGKVPFLPFIGIGPRRYLDLFSLDLSSGREVKRKDDEGRPILFSKTDSPPRVPMVALSYLEREDKLLEEFEDILRKLQGVKHGSNTIERPQLAEPDENGPAGERKG